MACKQINNETDVSRWKQPSSKPEKRVLFVLGILWGENGITTHLLTLAKGLQKSGWTVGLVTKLADDSPQALHQAQRAITLFESNGICCYQVDFLYFKFNPMNIFYSFISIIRLNQAISDFNPSIVHLHSLSISPYIYLLQKFHRFPYLSTCHMEPKENRSSVKFGKYLKKITQVILGQKIIAVSHVLRDSFVNVMGISKEKISLIHHGIDDDHFRPPSPCERQQARQSLGISDASNIVCMIGRLAPEKGHSTLIKSLSDLRLNGIEIHVLFAGQGYASEEDHIIECSDTLGVRDLIHLIGYSDTRQTLWASDVIVLPSQAQTEAFALVIAEAMLCGVMPIRTPGAGATDQIEEGVNGYLIPFEDSDVLTRRLKEVLEDRIKLNKMSTLSVQKAQNEFTSIQMIAKTISVYTELINKK